MHEDSIQGEKLSSSCDVSFKADEAIVRKGLVYDSSLFEKVLLALIGEDDIDGLCDGVEGVDMSFQSARKDVLSHSEHFVGEIHQHDQSLSLPADVNMCTGNISDHQYQLMSLDERLLLELQSIGLLLNASVCNSLMIQLLVVCSYLYLTLFLLRPDLAEEEQEDVIEQDINENLEELCHDAHGCEVTTWLTGAPFLGFGLALLLPKSSDQIKETSKSKTKLIPLTVNRSGRKSSGRVAPRSERLSSMPIRNTCPEESVNKSESTPPPVESVNKLESATIAITIQHSLEEMEMPNRRPQFSD